jgi:uncharacterized MAPEG superfamily protein
MVIAYWCILAALIAPYTLSMIARSQATQSAYVGDPRAYSDTLTGWHRRAHLAHLNAFEAVPAILSGVVVAELAGAPRIYIDGLALGFVALRVLHGLFYVLDKPRLRSLSWGFGMLCVIALFVVSAIHGGA